MTSNRKFLGLYALFGLALVTTVAAQDVATVRYTTLAKPDLLSMPSDVALGAGGQIYVVDGGNHQIAVFDAAGTRVTSLGMHGGEDGQLNGPVGIGISNRGEIYVADRGNQRVVMFAADGSPRRVIDLEEDGEAATPIDVAVSANGKELFITTNNSHRVLVYSNQGTFLRAWGGEGEDPGQFRFPGAIALDRAGSVYVVDVLNSRVQKFDPNGNILGTFGKRGGQPGTFFRPKGVAVDAGGRIYVSDSYLGAVQVLGPAGEFLYTLGDANGTTEFETPVGMAVNGQRLLVVEMLPGRVQMLELQK
jgi:DNA-binding beta-propeller fold protein YncE